VECHEKIVTAAAYRAIACDLSADLRILRLMISKVARAAVAWSLSTLLAAIPGAAVATAHFGSSAYILITADHVLPGQQFEVLAFDLTPNAAVSFRVVRDELGLTVPLETTTAPADGHFQIAMSVPQDFPEGYAQLFATAGDGTEVSTWVLVGSRTASTPPPPGTGPWWSDPSVIVLGVIVAGVVGAAGWMLLRRRSQAPAPARVVATTSAPTPRTGTSSKARRRRPRT
jgi:hypothetical protein